MPYATHYLHLLDRFNIDYNVVYWDRLSLGRINDWTCYVDNKISHERTFRDYLKFTRFVKAHCNTNKYDKIIIFGVQLAFFLSNYIKNNYSGSFIWDIRDYHPLLHFFNVQSFIESSNFVSISSPGYTEWLPNSNKFLICHNLPTEYLCSPTASFAIKNIPLNISYIGALRDYKLQSSLINELAYNPKIHLSFHGRGNANDSISALIKKNNINNTFITHQYDHETEFKLYQEASIINSLIPQKGINNVTLIPNRVYRAAINNRPLLALKGTRTATTIARHKIGLVLDGIAGCDKHILNYIENIDCINFEKNCKNFISEAQSDNEFFSHRLLNFFD